MGVRMMVIYGLPLGLLAAGSLIDEIGFAATGTLYAIAGLALMLGRRAALARRFCGTCMRRPMQGSRSLAGPGRFQARLLSKSHLSRHAVRL